MGLSGRTPSTQKRTTGTIVNQGKVHLIYLRFRAVNTGARSPRFLPMTVLKRRSRMISFRLSEEEYEGLKNVCVALGARSLSDIARDAVHRLLDDGTAPKRNVETELQLLGEKMAALDQEVRRLAGLVGQSGGVPRALDAANS